MRAVGNAHLPHSFSELFVAMLSPQTTYAQLNMCRCVASVIQSLKWAAHDRSLPPRDVCRTFLYVSERAGRRREAS